MAGELRQGPRLQKQGGGKGTCIPVVPRGSQVYRS